MTPEVQWLLMGMLPHNMTSEVDVAPVIVSGAANLSAHEGPRAKRWTREEYYHLGELGYFQNERVELVDGEILKMSPQSFEHSWSVDAIARLLQNVFGEEYWVRSQSPFPNDQWTDSEPDLLVTAGNRHDFTDHPTTAVLAVEVSKTSLRFDKTTMQSLYASMKVPDYWVLDLENRQLLVYRQPVADETAKFGHRYESLATIAADGHVASLEKPEEKLAVGEMLPPQK